MKRPFEATEFTPDEALDFVNHGSLAPGVSISGLAPPEQRQFGVERVRLRGAIEAAFTAAVTGAPPPEAVAFAINRVLEAGSVQSTLEPDVHPPRLRRRSRGTGPLALLTPVAHAAMLLLEHVDLRRLRRCAAEDCRVWFVDTSKGGRRRWCSMATCGNRAKAARYRSRQATD